MPEERPASIVGVWLMIEGGSSFPMSCDSGRPIQYFADGTYGLFAEIGTWRLEGKLLTETATSADLLHIDAEGVEVGHQQVSTIDWIDRDRFRKNYRSGVTSEFRRCPSTR